MPRIVPLARIGFTIGKLTNLTWPDVDRIAAETTKADGDVSYGGRFICTIWNDEDGGGMIDSDGQPMTEIQVAELVNRIDEN